MTTTQIELIEALKEADKVKFIEGLITKIFTTEDKIKVGHISLTRDINLETVEDNVSAITNRVRGVDYVPQQGNKPAHISMAFNVKLDNPQQLPQNPTELANDDRLITVANAFAIEIGLKDYIEKNFSPLPTNGVIKLNGSNPNMEMIIEKGGLSAQMQVIDKEKNRAVASMEYYKATNSFLFTLSDPNTGVAKCQFELKPDGKLYISGKEVTTVDTAEKMIREFRSTIEQDIADHAKPTRAECITTFKKLPHYNWAKDDDYYIKDTSGSKLVLIKYRANGATDEASAGNFFYEVLTPAK